MLASGREVLSVCVATLRQIVPREVGLVTWRHGAEEGLLVLLPREMVEGAQLNALVGVRVLHLLVGVHHALHVERVARERARDHA